MRMQRFGAVCAAGVVAAAGLAQGQVEIIYSGIPESGKSAVPGRPDLNIRAPLSSISQLHGSDNGANWAFQVFAVNASGDTVRALVTGSGTNGESFLTNDGPATFLPNFSGFSFFNSELGVANDGRVFFNFRADGGTVTNANNEGLALFDPATGEITELINGSDFATGVTMTGGNGNLGNSLRILSVAGNGTCIVYAGNMSVGSSLLNTAIWRGFPIQDPALLQRGSEVTPMNFLRSVSGNAFASAISADGSAWAHLGKVRFGEHPNDPVFPERDVLLVNGDIELERFDPLGDDFVDSVVAVTMSPNGQWYARGRLENGDFYAVEGGNLILQSGDPVPGGAIDEVVTSINTIKGYDNGDKLWVLETTGPDGDSEVAVLNNTVLARKGDPIDLDGNGQFDNDAFIRGFKGNQLFIGNDDFVYALINIEAGDGTNRGDAFARISTDPTPVCIPDLNNDGVVDADDFFLFLQLFADGDSRADINNDGVIDADDFFEFLNLFAQGC